MATCACYPVFSQAHNILCILVSLVQAQLADYCSQFVLLCGKWPLLQPEWVHNHSSYYNHHIIPATTSILQLSHNYHHFTPATTAVAQLPQPSHNHHHHHHLHPSQICVLCLLWFFHLDLADIHLFATYFL